MCKIAVVRFGGRGRELGGSSYAYCGGERDQDRIGGAEYIHVQMHLSLSELVT